LYFICAAILDGTGTIAFSAIVLINAQDHSLEVAIEYPAPFSDFP
jgi:hypothetical protein